LLALTARRLFRILATGLPALTLGIAFDARAAVTEPNGTQVPCLPPAPGGTGCSLQNNYSETSLQAYFMSVNEPINALVDASATPAVFQPLCNFKATLVLKQSQATVGLAWYNQGTPSTIYPIIPVTKNAGATLGQVVSSADIASSPNYGGGFVGFVLTRYTSVDNAPIYYSEAMNNANCTGCAMPGYWKMFLTYPSPTSGGTYYIAFEDWPGADSSTWQGNDGDFNDQVFKLEGVTCMGGGEVCETTGLGACKPGLTECGLGGAVVCHAQTTASPEKCDNFDNDCNGIVDDGDLCDPGYVCVAGSCVHNCKSGEFPCAGSLVCDALGFCVDPLCKDVMCPAGKACRAGNCVGSCDGISCPTGQTCDLGSGRCKAPCDGVTCPTDQVCEHGVCVANCSCRACPASEACNKTSGACVESGCETMNCVGGQICSAGACVDPCVGAVCPGGAACADGHCGEPIPGASGGAGGTSGSGAGATAGMVFSGGAAGVLGTAGALSTAGTFGTAGAAGSQQTVGNKATNSKPGCACRLSDGPSRSDWSALALGLAGLMALGRRRAARPRASID